MTEKGRWTLEKAIEKLLRNNVKVDNKTIYVRPGQVGIKLLGCIDFLLNYHGYTRKDAT